MMQWLGFTTPALAALGLLAIAAPIIIHLLNRRRFKTVDWAAMEFLLDAEKKNRRRVRLENLLLLLLRCLAMLLIGLVLARPYLESALTGRLIDSPRFQRVVLLDDSLSMQAQSDNQSAMEEAKRGLIEVLRGLAANESEDVLTLILTSQPDAPVVNGEPVTPDTIEQRVAEVEQLEPSDETANLDVALQEVERLLRAVRVGPAAPVKP